MEVNLPPFYDGQQVVFLGPPNDPNSKTLMDRGSQYTVRTCEYKFGNKDHPVGRITKYWYVGIVGVHDGMCYLAPYIFAPLQQKEFPALTFSEIVEAETEQVLMAN